MQLIVESIHFWFFSSFKLEYNPSVGDLLIAVYMAIAVHMASVQGPTLNTQIQLKAQIQESNSFSEIWA